MINSITKKKFEISVNGSYEYFTSNYVQKTKEATIDFRKK